MRTVTLEFLRHGPPHNQLLSPLTRYMVLCGNHQAADVSVPFEHAQFLTKLRAFQYKETETNRELQIAETAVQMSQILSSVPGLIAELADLPFQEVGGDSRETGEPKSGLTHLRLILSANELALLPFELANAGSAFPGAGQSLALQPHVPICITREVRRVNAPYRLWPSKPKILFAAASAGGQIPLDAHLLALRQALDPWLRFYEESETSKLEEHLTVLPMATVPALMEKIAGGDYTHIHLLAHGQEQQHEYGVRYGLALHDPANPMKTDFVEGTRLAALLRPSLRGRTEKLALPTVVTLAACESGGVGSVVGAGASIAHALHEAGIPLVVASQFPLSFAGSVVMTQVLYEGLLEGGDPRSLLIKLRRELVARVPQRHDWASVVAYASFPQDLERQLRHIRIGRVQERIRAALSQLDANAGRMKDIINYTTTDQTRKQREESLPKLEFAIRRMEGLLEEETEERGRVLGLLASAYKRYAEVLWGDVALSTPSTPAPSASYEKERRAIELVRKSREHYRESFEADRSQAWALVQSISLTAVVDGDTAFQSALRAEEVQLAWLLSAQERKSHEPQRHAWALGNLIELNLLAPIINQPPSQAPDSSELTRLVTELIDTVGPDSGDVYSVKSQVVRYATFFPDAAMRMATHSKRLVTTNWNAVLQAAKSVFVLFPETTRFERT